MVKMTGQLYNDRQNITQEFEAMFSSADGLHIGDGRNSMTEATDETVSVRPTEL
jgi:hypothetical protein